jgi:hypothetical protein
MAELRDMVHDLRRRAAKPDFAQGDVPPVANEAERAAYAAAAQEIYDSVSPKNITPQQRAASPEGRLAAALWARVTEWEDRAEEE